MNILNNAVNAVETANKLTRQAVLVNVGLYSYAYNAVKGQFTKVGSFIEELVEQGENIESQLKTQFELKAPAFVKSTVNFATELKDDVEDIVDDITEEVEEISNKVRKTVSRAQNKPAAHKPATKKKAVAKKPVKQAA